MERLKQAPAHDLEALLGGGRPPRGLHPADHVAQPGQGLPSPLTSHLRVIRLGMGRGIGVRGGKADDQHAVAGRLGRLGERLREGELGLEAAGRQVALIVELARVGDPLVDQDQTRSVLDEKLAQPVAGAGGMLVVSGHARERLGSAELPRQLAPEGLYHGAVGLGNRIAGRDAVADQHDTTHRGQFGGAGVLQHLVDAGQTGRAHSGEQVEERQHRVGLATAEVGLELHDRVAARSRQPLHGAGQQPPQAVGEEGAAEELHRVAVLVRSFIQVDLPQIGGEFRLLILAAGDVLVWSHHLPPWLQTRDRADGGRAPGGAAPLVA